MFINEHISVVYGIPLKRPPRLTPPVRPPPRPRLAPIPSQVLSKIESKLWSIFVVVLGAFGVVLGAHFGVLWGQISTQIHLGIGLTSKRSISLKHYKNQYKINKNAPRAPPKTILNRPKSVPGCYFSGLRFRPRFGIDFGSVRGRFWLPFGPLLAPFGRSKTIKK